jgi:hypothetical protein
VKITKTALRRIIKEELQRVLREDMDDDPRNFGPVDLERNPEFRYRGTSASTMGELLEPFAEELCPNRERIIAMFENRESDDNWQSDMADILSEFGVDYQIADRVAGKCDGEGCLEEALDYVCESTDRSYTRTPAGVPYDDSYDYGNVNNPRREE